MSDNEMQILDKLPTHESTATVQLPRPFYDRFIRRLKAAASEHSAEIFWALLFAILAGYAFALYLEDPKPYKIYVVVDHDTDPESLRQLQAQDQRGEVAKIGNVKVQVQLEMLPDQKADTVKEEATKLADQPDTLIVIEHGRSQKVERSVQTFFGVRPQIPLITTVATDADLLKDCVSPGSGGTDQISGLRSCYDGSWRNSMSGLAVNFAPLLQLSPTNDVQGRSAVMFATQSGYRHFLIVLGQDAEDLSYTSDMQNSYSYAIHAAHAELVGVQRMSPIPTPEELEEGKPDCILFAGGAGEARTLLNILSAVKDKSTSLPILLSDSVIQSRGKDADLDAFAGVPRVTQSTDGATSASNASRKMSRHTRVKTVEAPPPVLQPVLSVHFTDQSDAADYNSHTNQYIDDAFAIALQLIADLNNQGFDISYRIKAFLHVESVSDVRRNLVRVMRENFRKRAWYRSANGTTTYVFDGNKPYGGIFHVWQLKTSANTPGTVMEDVDNWHPPRSTNNLTTTAELSNK